MPRSNNLRKARDAGYRARYAGEKATQNPWAFVPGEDWRVQLRYQWMEGWQRANNELAGE